jgi:hypothetical protein
MPTPLQIIKDQHGSKDALIDKVLPLVEPQDGETKDEHKKRLKYVANAKLLHLHALGERVAKLGGRDKIVARILELRGQTKDHEYADSLKKLSLGRLVDMVASVERRTAGKAKKAPKRLRKKAG